MNRKIPAESVKMLVQQGYEQLQAEAAPEALEIFSAALAIEPKSPEALRGLGLARFQLKQWPAAIAAFRQARDLTPESTDNWVELGISLARDSQIYPALEVFEALLAEHPGCVRGYIELGMLYIYIGAIPKGRQQLENALLKRPTPAQRQLIQAVLKEQSKLDRKRLYRPDFEALNQEKAKKRSSGEKRKGV